MLYYDRIEISKEIDVNKTSESKEYNVNVKYWFDWKKWNLIKNINIYTFFYDHDVYKHIQALVSWFLSIC